MRSAILVGIARLCQTLSKLQHWTCELIVAHHSVKRLDIVVTRPRVHPVRVHKLNPRQTDGLDPGVDLLHGLIVVLLGDGDLQQRFIILLMVCVH